MAQQSSKHKVTKQQTGNKQSKLMQHSGDKFLVTFRISKDVYDNMSQTRRYREIKRIAAELDFERVGSSVYVVNSDLAEVRAHVLAELASRFGAGHVGDENGPTIWKLSEQSPADYFTNLEKARGIVDELLVDHRKMENKRKPRSIRDIIARLNEDKDDNDFVQAMKTAATPHRRRTK